MDPSLLSWDGSLGIIRPTCQNATRNGNHAIEEHNSPDHPNLGLFHTPDTDFSKWTTEALLDLQVLFSRQAPMDQKYKYMNNIHAIILIALI